MSFVINNEVYLFNGIVYGFGPAESISEAYKYDLANQVSSTEEENSKLQLSIQPNPANDYIQINTGEANSTGGNFRIYDITGKQVMKIDSNNQERIDISGLENGLYILSSEDNKTTRQFIISR